jgi:hypothetical protein
MARVAVSVLTCLALIWLMLVWCARTTRSGGAASARNDALEGAGGCPTASKTQASSAMTAPTKMNGMAEASRPLVQMLTFLIFRPQVDLQFSAFKV